ncbi:MAG TPA: glycosyltransferase [Vicinamibacterales bacterium]|nr:glycosyltransferase [Vicinamibacterales bacterium]
MSGHAPGVSVLLPVRNGLPWLGAAVASVCGQTFSDFELIIIEDGSTDGTPDLLKTLRDSRIRVIRTGGVGIARALNIGLDTATGPYVARQDADDESLPTRLARQAALLDSMPDIDVVSTVAEYVDVDGNLLDDEWVRIVRRQQDVAVTPEAIARLMPLTCCVTHGSIMARAAVLRAAGGYRPDLVPAEDYDLWLRLLPSHRFVKLGEPLYRYRAHAAQSGARSRPQQIGKTILAKLQYVRRLYPHLTTPARLAVLGATRGDELYRSVAAAASFQPVAIEDAWDVLAITDLGKVSEYERRLRLHRIPGLELVGNFFVRAPVVEERRSA